MYETLFRGKSESGKWRYGSLITADWYSDGKTYILQLGQKCQVISETVGQYIGRKNKHGKKIFVGDIARHHLGEDIGIVKFGEYKQPFDDIHTKHIGFFVDWISGSSKNTLRKDVGYWADVDNNSIYEIFIGENIHDNPELFGNSEQLKEE